MQLIKAKSYVSSIFKVQSNKFRINGFAGFCEVNHKTQFELYNLNFNSYFTQVKQSIAYHHIIEAQVENLNQLEKPVQMPKLKQSMQDRLNYNQSKFAMPFGWGWTFPFVHATTCFLLSAKSTLGISWIAFFVVSALTVRMLMLPLIIRQISSINKMSKISPNLKLLFRCTVHSNLPVRLKLYYYIRACLIYCKEIHVNPFMFVAYNLFQIPVFFLMIFSIRKISSETKLDGEGIMWFKNLSDPDPYMILPVMSVMITYYNLGVRSYLSIIYDIERDQ